MEKNMGIQYLYHVDLKQGSDNEIIDNLKRVCNIVTIDDDYNKSTNQTAFPLNIESILSHDFNVIASEATGDFRKSMNLLSEYVDLLKLTRSKNPLIHQIKTRRDKESEDKSHITEMKKLAVRNSNNNNQTQVKKLKWKDDETPIAIPRYTNIFQFVQQFIQIVFCLKK